MDREVTLSGLGFDMKFDIIDFMMNGSSDYISSEDYNNEFATVYRDFIAYKHNDSGTVLTYGEYLENSSSSSEFNQVYLDLNLDNNSLLTSGAFKHFWKLLPQDLLAKYLDGLLCKYSPSTSSKSTLRDFISDCGNPNFMEFSLVRDLYLQLKDDGYTCTLDEFYTKQIAIRYFYSFHRMKMVYLSTFLKLPIKSFNGTKAVCDKLVGEFSATYKVKIKIGNTEIKSDVVIKSKNFVE